MRRITYRSSRVHRSRAGELALLLMLGTAASIAASTRPKYGGTLRVQIGGRVATIDPRQWPADSEQAAATEHIAGLVFDRLVRFDDHGTPAPALAISWQHDAENNRWQFLLRPGVSFSDGTPFTAEAAALALQQLLGNAFDVSATKDSVVIQSDHALPNLPAQLAGGRYFIFRASDDGSLYGTGPFNAAQWPALAPGTTAGTPEKLVLAANQSCWAGRPFVDQVEITMGVSAPKQANAVAFGEADVVELTASQVRGAVQRGVRTAASDPINFYALEFDASQPAPPDRRVREVISLALDRASLADVILQRQGAAASGLLPNWLSGYVFLFSSARDLPRARDLLSAARVELSRVPSIELVYSVRDPDPNDSSIQDSNDEARVIAERVALNLREAGLIVQLSGTNSATTTKAAAAGAPPAPARVRLVRRHIEGPDARVALDDLLASFGESAAPLATAQETYNAEREFVSSFHVVPLAFVSETYGLGPRVRDWLAPKWGGWRLEDVWLAQPEAGSKGSAAQ